MTSLPADSAVVTQRTSETRRYLRGSSMLLSGRGISMVLNLATQLLTVRYLSKSDYGAFAYALGVASAGSTLVLLGLDKTVGRFVPIYQERGEEGKAFGTLAVSTALVWGVGTAAFLLLVGFGGALQGSVVKDRNAFGLLLALIALAPIEAFNRLLESVMAVFVSARAIFARRHVLGPVLKLVTVLAVIAVGGGAYLLAAGYVVGALIGVGLYVAILLRAWHGQGKLAYLRPSAMAFPTREVLAFSLPLLVGDLLVDLPRTLAVVFLEHYHSTSAVASFRAVLPLAQLNIVVLRTFALLFIPIASRMFARNDREGLNDLYWRTATWISVLTFPVFAATVCLARPLTLLLFGPEYVDAASVLAVLSIGYYFNAALGFNVHTLRVHGDVRSLVVVNIATAVLGFGLMIPLSARYGPMGAAIGSTAALVLQNLFAHAALLVVNTGVRLLDWGFMKTYVVIAAMVAGLLTLQRVVNPPIYVGVAAVAVASLILLRFCRHILQAGHTFPELLRVPLLRRLLA